MLAALATLAFAATLWLIFVLLAGMLEESGGRILAAAQALPIASAEASPGERLNRARGHRRCPTLSRADWRAAA